jgi:hypothetical protein
MKFFIALFAAFALVQAISGASLSSDENASASEIEEVLATLARSKRSYNCGKQEIKKKKSFEIEFRLFYSGNEVRCRLR